jgi:hypothetical protein
LLVDMVSCDPLVEVSGNLGAARALFVHFVAAPMVKSASFPRNLVR